MEGYLVDGFRLHQPVNCPDQLYTVRKLSLIRKKVFFNPPLLQVMVSCWAGRAQHRAAIPALYSHLKQFSAQLQQFVWVQQQTMFSAIVLVNNKQSLSQAARSYHSQFLSFEATQVAIPSDIWTLFEFWFLVPWKTVTSFDQNVPIRSFLSFQHLQLQCVGSGSKK